MVEISQGLGLYILKVLPLQVFETSFEKIQKIHPSETAAKNSFLRLLY